MARKAPLRRPPRVGRPTKPREIRCVPCDDAGNEFGVTPNAAAGSASRAERPGASAPGPASTIPSSMPLPWPRAFQGVRGRCKRIREFPERAGWTVLLRIHAEEEGEHGRCIGLKGELLVFWDGVERPPFEEGRDYYFHLAAG